MDTITPVAPVTKLSYPADVVRRAIDRSGLNPQIFFAYVDFDFKKFPFKDKKEASTIANMRTGEEALLFKGDTVRSLAMKQACLDFVIEIATEQIKNAKKFEEIRDVFFMWPPINASQTAQDTLFPAAQKKAIRFLRREKETNSVYDTLTSGIWNFQITAPDLLEKGLRLMEEKNEKDGEYKSFDSIFSFPIDEQKRLFGIQFPKILEKTKTSRDRTAVWLYSNKSFLLFTPKQLKHFFKVHRKQFFLDKQRWEEHERLECEKLVAQGRQKEVCVFKDIEEELGDFFVPNKNNIGGYPKALRIMGRDEEEHVFALDALKTHFASTNSFQEVFTFFDDCTKGTVTSTLLNLQKSRLKELMVTPEECVQMLNLSDSDEEIVALLENIFKLATLE